MDLSENSSDGEARPVDCHSLYDRQRWLKVTFDSDTKRFLDPPKDYELLVLKIQSKFPVLKMICEHPSRP